MNNQPAAAPNNPPPIEKVIVYAPDLKGGFIEIPPEEIGTVQWVAETGAFQLIQVCPDGHLERWINVAARMIHKIPGRILTVPPGARI
jgi:hypothetical protein